MKKVLSTLIATSLVAASTVPVVSAKSTLNFIEAESIINNAISTFALDVSAISTASGTETPDADEEATTTEISIKINGATVPVTGSSLEEAVMSIASGADSFSIEKLEITSGKITAADWAFMKSETTQPTSSNPSIGGVASINAPFSLQVATISGLTGLFDGMTDLVITTADNVASIPASTLPTSLVNITLPAGTPIAKSALISLTSLATITIVDATGVALTGTAASEAFADMLGLTSNESLSSVLSTTVTVGGTQLSPTTVLIPTEISVSNPAPGSTTTAATVLTYTIDSNVTVVEFEDVKIGDVISLAWLETPTSAGKTFEGWYYDQTLTNKITGNEMFSIIVTSEIIENGLWAKFVSHTDTTPGTGTSTPSVPTADTWFTGLFTFFKK